MTDSNKINVAKIKRKKYESIPGVKWNGKGGPPPKGHERQCKARRRHVDEQCQKWALRGSDFCQFHGGRRSKTTNMPRGFYLKKMGPTLKERLLELQNQSKDERYSLEDEIDVAMNQLTEALATYEQIVIEGKLDTEAGQNIAARSAASKIVKDLLSHVREMKLDGVKIELLKKDKVPVCNIKWFICAVMTTLNDVLGKDPQYAGVLDECLTRINQIRVLDNNVPNVSLNINV